jgi:hypothetical protein
VLVVGEELDMVLASWVELDASGPRRLPLVPDDIIGKDQVGSRL